VATIVLFGSYGVIHAVVKNKVSLIGQKLTDANYQLYKSATEALSSIKYIKVSGSEVGFVKSFYGPSEEIAGYQTKSHMFSLVPRYILEVIIFGGMIIIVMTLGGDNSEIIPVVSLYAMAGYRLMPAIQSMYSGIISIKYNISAFDLLVSDLSKSDESKEMNFKLKKHTLKFNHKIELKDINYTYLGASHSIIDKLNLTIEKNTVVGIVGTTGSGKTTLVDILLGLLVPSAGYIKLDETRLGKNNISNWQGDVGYVPQSVYLLDGSIRRNIAFGIPNDKINEDQIIRVAKMASLHDFILSLPEKYDTLVGERGVRLSGGQQQRISIARALYHNPSVLMLDEATSALDSVTENTIMDAIHNLAHKKTIIMIAHRLSTIKECDIVHMMDAGTIVASGTYQQLIVDNKDFRAMANAT
jgi:ABC-type multidrug transport system fused ATPase/permease subunit